jgi:hypothetical protein
MTRYICTNGHYRCYGGASAGPECPYCERRTARKSRARNDILEEAAEAVRRQLYGPPTSWGADNPRGWHLERDCTPADAAMHDNGCLHALQAILNLKRAP